MSSESRSYIHGIVLEEGTGNRLVGITVTATRAGARRGEPLGTAVTGPDGRFRVWLRSSGVTQNGSVRLLFSFGGESLNASPGSQTEVDRSSMDRELAICMPSPHLCIAPDDLTIVDPGAQWTVYGLVRHEDGTPLANVPVRAMARSVASSTPLGSPTSTNPEGLYQVMFAAPGPGQRPPHVAVEVLDGAAQPAVLFSSDVAFFVGPATRLDVTATGETYRGPSEFARVQAGVEMERGDVDFADIDDDALTFLEGAVMEKAAAVSAYVRSGAFNEGLDDPSWHEQLYALVRLMRNITEARLYRLSIPRLTTLLDLAATQNVISRTAADAAAACADALLATRVAQAIDPTSENSLVPLAAASGLTPEQQDKVARRWAERTGTVDTYWSGLTAEIGAPAVAKMKAGIAMHRHAESHVPMVEVAVGALGSGPMSGIAVFTRDQWGAFIDGAWSGGAEVGVPDDIPGSSPAFRRENYITALRDNAEREYPSTRVRAEVLADQTAPASLRTYMENNEDFEIGTTPVVGTDAAAVAAKKYQRLFAVSPDTSRWQGMAAIGVDHDSAFSIARTQRTAFVAEYSIALGGEDVAVQVYQLATARVLVANLGYAAFHPDLQTPISVLSIPIDTSLLRDYDSIYATSGNCNCDPCLTITSPAAYLVDLLAWAEALEMTSAVAVDPNLGLSARRPDLRLIELSCDNTYKVLPYIDLVNEILETAVLEGAGATPTINYVATTLDAAELLVTPEYIVRGAIGPGTITAYDVLDGANRALGLPYHRWNDQTRVFLGQLGISRTRLLATMAYPGSPAVHAADASAEALALSAAEIEIITAGATATGQVRWGFEGTLGWVAKLEVLQTFMDRSGLSYASVLELLHCRAANPGVDTGLSPYVFLDATDPCDTTKIRFRYNKELTIDLTAAQWTRLSRMLRVCRALSLGPLDTDRVLHALGVTDANDDTELTGVVIGSMGATWRLAALVGRPPLTLLGWFADLDVYADRDDAAEPNLPRYDRLFLDAGTFPEAADPDGNGWVFRLNPTRTELTEAGTALLIDNTAAIAAALGASLAEVGVARAWVDSGGEAFLTLANVSAVVRRVELAAALGVSVAELKGLIAGSDLDPFWSPENALQLVQELRGLASAGFGPAHVLYLSAHSAESAARVGVSDARLQEDLGGIRDRIRAKATGFDTSEDVETMSESEFTAWVDNEFTESADWGAALAETIGIGWTQTGGEQETRWTALKDLCGDNADLADALDLRDFRANLIGAGGVPSLLPPTLPFAPQRFAFAQRMMRWGQFRAAHADALREEASQQIAAALGHSMGFMGRVREESFVAFSDGRVEGSIGVDLIDLLLTRSFLALDNVGAEANYLDIARNDDLDALPAAVDDAIDLYVVIHKVALLFAGLGLDEFELTWWFDLGWGTVGDPTPFGLLDVRTLRPWPQLASNVARYAGVRNARVLFAQRDRLPGADPNFADVLDDAVDIATEPETFAATIATRTGWDAADITAVCAAFGYDTDPTLFQDPAEFRRLVDVLEHAHHLGVPATTLLTWFEDPRPLGAFAYDATEIAAEGALNAARSRYPDADAWGPVARPLRDGLRARQRDALVRWLLNDPDSSYDDENDLFARFLIDPQMSPIMLTSRIRQASCSVQAYLQRNMMGFDRAALVIEEAVRDQWEWKKQYRVWEAARKVFLYPENWIDPTLRTDKTELFEKAEGVIVQGELNAETAEEAVLAYTRGLAGIAALTPATFMHEQVDDQNYSVHVVGRSDGEIMAYYYRRRDEGVWSNWERIEAGITGIHLSLAMDGSRVYLVWLQWGKDADTTEADVPKVTSTWRTVQVHWIERLGAGKWSEAQASRVYDLDFNDGEGDGTMGGLCADMVKKMPSDPTKDDGHFTHFIRSGVGETFRLYTSVNASTHVVKVLVTCSVWQDYPVAACHIQPATGSAEWSTPELEGKYDESRLRPRAQGDRLKSADVKFSDSSAPANLDALYFWQSSEANSYCAEDDATRLLATKMTDAYLLCPREHDLRWPDSFLTFFIAVDEAVFFVHSGSDSLPDADATELTDDGFEALQKDKFAIERFYHPYATTFLETVVYDGAFGLLFPTDDATGTTSTLARQQLRNAGWFDTTYGPNTEIVSTTHASRTIEFHAGGAYSAYNWELFFHLPMLLATRLAAEQKFEDAFEWLHCVFDPRSQNVDYNPQQRPWRFKPFTTHSEGPSVEDWADFVGTAGSEEAADFSAQVSAWMADPFNPHLLAMLRPGTYERWVVMTYLDTLIAWADRLFTQDTTESVNEATQLYLIAGDILGDRPSDLGGSKRTDVYSYATLTAGTPVVDIENQMISAFDVPAVDYADPGALVICSSGVGDTYFCVPKNERLYAYWDTIADRLFKIRNSLDISGRYRAMSLYAAPIDPALLVRAGALGVDIATAIASAEGALPNHRFSVMQGRARSLAETVRSFGGALLSALEKKDAEDLALLRSTQEMTLLDAVTGVRSGQVTEAEHAVEGLKKQVTLVEARRVYYADLLDAGINEGEALQVSLKSFGLVGQAGMAGIYFGASAADAIPAVGLGSIGYVEFSGKQISNAGQNLAAALNATISSLNMSAELAGLGAGWQRRADEWEQQESQAKLELNQLAIQQLGADVRLDIARRELANHKIQVENTAQIDEWMRAKYTSAELYNWMLQKLSGLHLSAYDLALTTARKAEACYRHELGVADSTFVQYAYWDSLRSGLLAGEALIHDLDRMDAAYLDNDTREFELTKHISLSRLDPVALARFRASGDCYFKVPEALFDLDCPGHYFRRVQSVALSVACVGGSRSAVNVELTLQASRVRRSADTGVDPTEDGGTLASIVTSASVEDAGLFQTDLRDPRYLPFERRGAVSDWNLRMSSPTYRSFDWESITDVVLHLRYTARADDTETFRDAVIGALPTTLAVLTGGGASEGGTSTGLVQAVSLARDLPDELYRVQQPSAATPIAITLGTDRLPYFASATVTSVRKVHVIARMSSGSFPTSAAGVTLQVLKSAAAPTERTNTASFAVWPAAGSAVGLASSTSTWTIPSVGTETPLSYWPGTLNLELSGVDAADLADLIVVLEYDVAP